ncbi:serine/threonine-protein kinase RsbW [Dethiosulfatibacter aminovorans DSM 17477]|uniref:Serine/threonine-protein kinase RsbW n=1 Tax=Dethiosulfatibacter aminovorans DSM 17477 TaxID=1121476 RepID=A0A1M6AM71_9FIRM|nr:ATP-binding protein [Dethiosulfatibacter aminovorans]SHI37531.1 serine/threonine-protein kinase RsbW [Dethiosulfatibacter aminovorans DSM 17477]
MSDRITLDIPKKSDFISIIRLTTSSIVNKLDFNIDEVDDLKILVAEISVMFIRYIKDDNRNLRFEFILDGDLIKIDVTDMNEGDFRVEDDDLSMLIIESLSDEYSIDEEGKRVTIVKKCS